MGQTHRLGDLGGPADALGRRRVSLLLLCQSTFPNKCDTEFLLNVIAKADDNCSIQSFIQTVLMPHDLA